MHIQVPDPLTIFHFEITIHKLTRRYDHINLFRPAQLLD